MTRVVAGVLLLGTLLTACGGDPPLPDRLAGKAVAAMAERELEAENPRLATGHLECPDLDLRVGATVRCLRTTELSGGRVVRVEGTVRVTSVAEGGRLHVAMDDRAREFGLTGARVADGVREQYARRHHVVPAAVDCPYLRGVVGTVATCHVEAGDRRRLLDVAVTSVDPDGYTTRYVVRRHRGGD